MFFGVSQFNSFGLIFTYLLREMIKPSIISSVYTYICVYKYKHLYLKIDTHIKEKAVNTVMLIKVIKNNNYPLQKGPIFTCSS